jgi:DNA-binding transcriptional MocR family regulator
MSNRQDRRGRSKSQGRFVQLHHWMLNSPAWRALKASSRAVYVELSMRYNGFNNGTLALSARDAARLCNINKDTATQAFRQLIEHGFIERVTPGGFSCKVRHATEWRLTDSRCDVTGALPTKAFAKWRPLQIAVPIQGPDGPKLGTSNGPNNEN